MAVFDDTTGPVVVVVVVVVFVGGVGGDVGVVVGMSCMRQRNHVMARFEVVCVCVLTALSSVLNSNYNLFFFFFFFVCSFRRGRAGRRRPRIGVAPAVAPPVVDRARRVYGPRGGPAAFRPG